MVVKTTSVPRSKPRPDKLIIWPGLADASPVSSGAPLPALAVMPFRLMMKAALVPPTVVT